MNKLLKKMTANKAGEKTKISRPLVRVRPAVGNDNKPKTVQ